MSDEAEWESVIEAVKPFPAEWACRANAACIDDRSGVLSIRPNCGGSWLILDVMPDIVQQLNDFTEGDEPGDTYEIRFGLAPIGWTRTLPEHDGW